MRYQPELDGIRALAVLAVLASHSGIALAQGGWTGVEVFFVLSGYLITRLLLAERDTTGRIDLGRFYVRRALRLFPALALVLVAGLAFHDRLGDGTLTGYGRAALTAGLYLQDFVAGCTGSADGGFGHTWSLAVEEQFYLIWPVVLVLVLRRRRDPLVWATVGVAAGWLSMVVSLRPSPEGVPFASYYLPWNQFPQLLVGAALAVVVARRAVPRAVGRAGFGWTAVACCACVAGLAASSGRYPGLAWQAPAVALATAGLLWHLAADTGSPVRRTLSIPPLVWLGRRSYGIYLFHVPVLEVLQASVPWRRSVITLAMLAITLVVAALSYRYVESPFLRWKNRLGPPAPRGDVPPPRPGSRPSHADPRRRPRVRATP